MPDRRNTRRSTHQNYFVDLFCCNARIRQSLFAGPRGAVQYRLNEQLENVSWNLALIAIAVGQLDVEPRYRLSRQADLGVNGRLAQSLHGGWMRAQIDAVLGIDLVQRNGQQEVVNVISTQVRVAVGRLHLEDAVTQLEDGDIKGAAAQVIDSNRAFLRPVKAISQCGCCRFIDQPQHVQASHAACVLGGLALRIIEVRRHGNDCLRDRRAEKSLGVPLELAQHVGGNLRRRELQFAQLNTRHFTDFYVVGQTEGKQLELALDLLKPPSHQPLDGIDNPLRRFNQCPAGRFPRGARGPP